MLVLAGVAFATAGPAAILACVVAWLTAMSVTEISTAFPESGGAYTFAKKVLNVRAAFVVGWVLWFAYIVAGVLYALAFASFTVILMRAACEGLGLSTEWLDTRTMAMVLATVATAGYSVGLVRTSSGGGQWVTVGKVVLFLFLIAAGAVALVRQPFSDVPRELGGFFSGGFSGLVTAMGLMFISLQGFEMVSAIAGEIKEPRRTIPKAIFGSLAISLAIYVPLLFLVATAGVDGGHNVMELAAGNPDTMVAAAARQFLGGPGYWFVIVAIALATLSALQANLLTASRIAYAMAHDHALPSVLEQTHPTRGTPVMAIYATALATVAIMFMIPDLTSAGAAASLIFLLAFALTHVTAYLARKRGGPVLEGGRPKGTGSPDSSLAYRTPWFPVVPIVGGLACAGLAVFQAIVVPEAGKILVIWLGLGVMLYMALFKGRAEAADASAEGLDPRLNQLRGKNPLVLLPIANPKSARSLVEIANALAPSEYARVLVLTIIRAMKGGQGDPLAQLADAQEAVREALSASYNAGHAPEAMITAAVEPWPEIKRIAEEHACESLLIGLPQKVEPALDRQLETLMNEVDCDITMMRAPDDWKIANAKRVLVPIAGKSEEAELRARILASLSREAPRELVFFSVLPAAASDDELAAAMRTLTRLAAMKLPGTRVIEVVRSDDATAAILAAAARCDLVVLGMRRSRQGKKQLGTINRKIVADAACAVLLLSTQSQIGVAELTRPIRDVAQLVPFVPKRAD
jgi:amino acid transporter/nucleotide-binding universal stress UspA family protein